MAVKRTTKENNYKVLGILIRSKRINKGYSLRELASITNISHTLISNIEKGQQIPTKDTLSDIFDALDLEFYDDPELTQDFYDKEEEIYNHLFNHDYEKADELLSIFKDKREQLLNSVLVVDFFLLHCLYHAYTETSSDCIDEQLEHYEKVIEFFTEYQTQMFYFIKGLNYLNKEAWNRATDFFNQALKLGNKNIDVFIKEANVISLIRQYKFIDAYRFSESVIKELENRTIYVRVMKTKLQVARIMYHIAKNDETLELVSYVERFASKYNLVELTEECLMLRAAIKIRIRQYDEADEVLSLMPNPESLSTVLLRFKIAFVQNDLERLEEYYKQIEGFETITSHEKVWTYLQVQAMSKLDSLYDKESYFEKISRLTEIAVKNNDQEMIGLAHNYLIMYHHEDRSYKKALEIAEKLLRLKKIRIEDR